MKILLGKALPLFLSLTILPIVVRIARATPDEDVSTLSSPNSVESSAAENRLRGPGSSMIPALLRGLDNPNSQVRYKCLYILKEKRPSNPDDISFIAKKGRLDSNLMVRLGSIETLRAIKIEPAIRELKSFGENDPSEVVRGDADAYVGRIAPRQEEKYLRSRLADKNVGVRLFAYAGLARTGDRSGHQAAIKTLSSSSIGQERDAAIQVISAIADPNDKPLLQQLLTSKTEHHRVKLEAIFALHHIELLQVPQDQQLEFLIKALDSKGDAVRMWAAGELEEKGGSATVDALKAYLSTPKRLGGSEATLVLYNLTHNR